MVISEDKECICTSKQLFNYKLSKDSIITVSKVDLREVELGHLKANKPPLTAITILTFLVNSTVIHTKLTLTIFIGKCISMD